MSALIHLGESVIFHSTYPLQVAEKLEPILTGHQTGYTLDIIW